MTGPVKYLGEEVLVRVGLLPERCVGAGEWMTSGDWRQAVWDGRVRSTQLGWNRTHSWREGTFLHKTGL